MLDAFGRVLMGRLDKTAYLRCDFCGSTRVRRCRRRGFVERVFLRFLRKRPFHCIDCYKRFYSRYRPIDVQPNQRPAITYRSKLVQEQPNLKPKTSVNYGQAERRIFSRLRCQIPAQIVVGSGPCITGVVSGISLNGCFMETPRAVPVGSEIELSLAEGTHSRGLIRGSIPARGIGIEFTQMTLPNFRRLQSIARNSVRLDVNP